MHDKKHIFSFPAASKSCRTWRWNRILWTRFSAFCDIIKNYCVLTTAGMETRDVCSVNSPAVPGEIWFHVLDKLSEMSHIPLSSRCLHSWFELFWWNRSKRICCCRWNSRYRRFKCNELDFTRISTDKHWDFKRRSSSFKRWKALLRGTNWGVIQWYVESCLWSRLGQERGQSSLPHAWIPRCAAVYKGVCIIWFVACIPEETS